jgi:WD40 repeat protein
METPGRFPTTWNEDGSLAVGLAESGSQTIASTSDGSVRYVAPPGWTIHAIGWDGSLVLLGQGPDDLLPRVVDTASGTTLFELADQVIFWRTGSFTRRGDLLMVDNQVYDVHTGDEIGGMPELEAAGYAFSPDNSTLAVTTWLGDLLLYDTTRLLDGLQLDGSLILEIKAHNAQAMGLGWSSDSSMIATAELGGQVRVWDPATGAMLQEFDSTYDVDNQFISFHPTDPHIYTLGPNGTVRVYTHDVDELIAIAQSRLTRGMTEHECQQYLGDSCEDQ